MIALKSESTSAPFVMTEVTDANVLAKIKAQRELLAPGSDS
jgi:hypothetical protein